MTDHGVTLSLSLEEAEASPPGEGASSSSLPVLSSANISAVNFTVQAVDERRVNVTITEPLSGVHEGDKQLSLRDIFKSELKYKISYYKFGSTGKVHDPAATHAELSQSQREHSDYIQSE